MMGGMTGPTIADRAAPAHVLEAENRQAELIRAMTPARRLEIARELYHAAWSIKLAAVRSQHPDWSAERVAATVRLVFLTGYAGT
jgi:hypothetical protein